MADAVRDTDLGYNEIIKETLSFSKTSILIGFQEGTLTREEIKKGRRKDGGQSIPQIAFENEFGTKLIPARSFLRTSFDENIQKIQQNIIIQYKKVQDGKITSQVASERIGARVVKMVKQKIRAIVSPPNSARTIKEKGSSKPLIDFGQMVNAVAYKVVQ